MKKEPRQQFNQPLVMRAYDWDDLHHSDTIDQAYLNERGPKLDLKLSSEGEEVDEVERAFFFWKQLLFGKNNNKG